MKMKKQIKKWAKKGFKIKAQSQPEGNNSIEELKKKILEYPKEWDYLDEDLKTEELRNFTIEAWKQYLSRSPYEWSRVPEELLIQGLEDIVRKYGIESHKKTLLKEPNLWGLADEEFKTEETRNATIEGWKRILSIEGNNFSHWGYVDPEFRAELRNFLKNQQQGGQKVQPQNNFNPKDNALRNLKNGVDPGDVVNEFIADSSKMNPNFKNGPWGMILLSLKNNPEELYKFIQGFNR